jgi:Translation initiation factor IF-2, N-terminal region
MSKRVYEIARELDLNTKEVIGQLNNAGVEVRSNFAVVEDSLVERVFGDGLDGSGSNGAASNGRFKVQQTEGLQSAVRWLWEYSLRFRVVMYILAAALAFVLAAGVGAAASLIMQRI